MKKILSILVCCIMLASSVVSANAISLHEDERISSTRWDSGSFYMASIQNESGKIVISVFCKADESADKITANVSLIDTNTSKVVYGRNVQLSYSELLRKHTATFRWKPAKYGKYKVQATFQVYSKGKLVETVTTQSPICEYK